MQHPPRAKTWRSPASKDGCGAARAEQPRGVASARAQGGATKRCGPRGGGRAGSTRRLAAAGRTYRRAGTGGGSVEERGAPAAAGNDGDDDEVGSGGGGTRGRHRPGRAADLGGWRRPGKRLRWPTSRLFNGTR